MGGQWRGAGAEHGHLQVGWAKPGCQVGEGEGPHCSSRGRGEPSRGERARGGRRSGGERAVEVAGRRGGAGGQWGQGASDVNQDMVVQKDSSRKEGYRLKHLVVALAGKLCLSCWLD